MDGIKALALASVALGALAATAVQAQTTRIYGGSASTSSPEYGGPNVFNSAIPTAMSEMDNFNTANPSYAFQIFNTTSAKTQAAFAANNPSLLDYAGQTPLPPKIDYGSSESPLGGANGTTVNGFTYKTAPGIPGVTPDYATRLSQDGALIQIPMLGVGLAIAGLAGNSAVRANGTLKLTDNDLCGIFSGRITNYGQIETPVVGISGRVTVYYRPDSAGTSFTLSNHLKYVCNSGNSSFPNLAAAPTSVFPTLFNGTVPGNFIGVTSVSAAATALAGTVTTAGGSKVGQPGDPTGISYLGADYTAISRTGRLNATAAATPPGGYIYSRRLFVASLNGALPTIQNIRLALANPGPSATDPVPPTGTAARNPLNWVTVLPAPTRGYPIVSTSNFILAQCYGNANNAAGLRAFIMGHYYDSASKSLQYNNGFALPTGAFLNAISRAFLTATSPLGINTAGQGACGGASGR